MKLAHNRVSLNENAFKPSALTPRGVLVVFFRRRRLLALTFLGALVGAIIAILLLPSSYEAEVKFLVERQRIDPMVTSDDRAGGGAAANRRITEDEINSEVELIMSRDLLEKVVIASHLYETSNPWSFAAIKQRILDAVHLGPDQKTKIFNAVLNLEQNLKVATLPSSDLIKASYTASNPLRAADVLSKLSSLYIEKNAAVHRPPGSYTFFEQQAETYQKALADAQARLVAFNRSKGIVSAELEKPLTLQKMNEFETSLRQTKAAIEETKQRARSLESTTGSMQKNVTTAVRTSANSQVLDNLKSTLFTLELKRTELLQKFAPTYRLVQETDQKIAQTRSAIAEAEKLSLREETVGRDPTYDWAQTELAKARADLVGLEARATVTGRTIASYQEKLLKLDNDGTTQQNLQRAVKSSEENYVLFRQKQEEAGISDALNQRQILNVSIAQPASIPMLPTGPVFLLKALLGAVLAGLVSIGTALGAEYLDPSFRTPAEVESELSIPVLAAVPYTLNGSNGNGHAHLNGNGHNVGGGTGHGTNGRLHKNIQPVI